MARPRAQSSIRGTATAELSLLLPFLLVAVLGTTDFARICFQTIAIANAAQAGAKYATHSPSHATDSVGIQTAVLNDLQDTAAAADVAVESERYCTCPDGGSVSCVDGTCGGSAATRRTYVRVRVEKTFEALFPYPGVPASVQLVREARVRAR